MLDRLAKLSSGGLRAGGHEGAAENGRNVPAPLGQGLFVLRADKERISKVFDDFALFDKSGDIIPGVEHADHGADRNHRLSAARGRRPFQSGVALDAPDESRPTIHLPLNKLFHLL